MSGSKSCHCALEGFFGIDVVGFFDSGVNMPPLHPGGGCTVCGLLSCVLTVEGGASMRVLEGTSASNKPGDCVPVHDVELCALMSGVLDDFERAGVSVCNVIFIDLVCDGVDVVVAMDEEEGRRFSMACTLVS